MQSYIQNPRCHGVAKRKKQIQSEKQPIFKSYEMLEKVRCVVAHRRNKKTMYDKERVRGRKMQIEGKVEERSEMILFFFKGEEGTMQCLHLGQLVGREHLGIGKEELKLGSRFHFNQPIFLQFMEKLESCEEVVLV